MEAYTNPLAYRGGQQVLNPDPFVVQHGGVFYTYSTSMGGVQVSSSPDLVSWDFHGFAYREEGRDSYWAPCVIYRNGVFYLYVSNRPAGAEDAHSQRMRVAQSANPLGPFSFVATMEDFFLIDADVVSGADGKDYMFYASNEFTEFADRPGTALVLDGMKDPTALAGRPRPVIIPTLDEEIFAENRFGDGRDWHTIEGGAYFERRNLAYMTYSGNAYVRENYFIGYATSPREPSVGDTWWTKHPDEHTYAPLIRRNEDVEGTGHNSIIRAPNLVDWWIVYHGRDADEPLLEDIEQRQMRIDPLHFDGDTLFTLAPTSTAEPAPWQPTYADRFIFEDTRSLWHTVRGDVQFGEGKATFIPGTLALFGEPVANFVAEVSLRALAPFCLVPLFESPNNYFQVAIDPAEKTIAVESVISGQFERLAWRLASNVDFTQWQTLRVEKMGESLAVKIGNQLLIRFEAFAVARTGQFGVISEGDLEVNTISVTEHFDWYLRPDGNPLFDLASVAPRDQSADVEGEVRLLPSAEGGVRVDLDVELDGSSAGFAAVEVLSEDGECVASLRYEGEGFEGRADLGKHKTEYLRGSGKRGRETLAVTVTAELVTLRVGQEVHTWPAHRSATEKYFPKILTKEASITGLSQTNIKIAKSRTTKRSGNNGNK